MPLVLGRKFLAAYLVLPVVPIIITHLQQPARRAVLQELMLIALHKLVQLVLRPAPPAELLVLSV